MPARRHATIWAACSAVAFAGAVVPTPARAAAAPSVAVPATSLLASRTPPHAGTAEFASSTVRTRATPESTLTATVGDYSGDGKKIRVQTFTSSVFFPGSTNVDSNKTVQVGISAGIKPGNYTVDRIPGVEQAVLTAAETCHDGLPHKPTMQVLEAVYDSAGQPVKFAANWQVPCYSRITHEGPDDAWLTLPDSFGGPGNALVTPLLGRVRPLREQPVGVYAVGGFRRMEVVFGKPSEGANGLGYVVERIRTDGSREEIPYGGFGFGFRAILTGLPDGSSHTFQVTSVRNGVRGPASVVVTASTATRQLLHIENGDGLRTQHVRPTPSKERAFADSEGSSVCGDVSRLSVSRNQATFACDDRDIPDEVSTVRIARVDGTGTAVVAAPLLGAGGWNVDPAVSPDGARVVFTRAATSTDPGTVLRLFAYPPDGRGAVDVPGSEGLFDATFSTDGQSLVAVRKVDDTTELVTLPLAGGTPEPVPNSRCGNEPDVGLDGRIAMTVVPDSAWPGSRSIVVLDPGVEGGRLVLPELAVPASADPASRLSNQHPVWSPDGTSLWFRRGLVYEHARTGPLRTDAWALNLPTRALTQLTATESRDEDTAFVLTAEDDPEPAANPTAPPGPDTAAPAFVLTGPTATHTLDTTATLAWTAGDAGVAGRIASGVANYDARYRTQSARNAFGSYSYPATWQGITTPGTALVLKPGYQYCVSARARDHAGNVSAWSPERCVTTPLDDRSYTTKASRKTGSSYWLGTYSRSTNSGTTFTRSDTTASRIGVVATTCSTCGSLEVRLGGRKIGTLKLTSSTTKRRQVLWLPAFTRTTGTLTLKTTSSKQVNLDGVITER